MTSYKSLRKKALQFGLNLWQNGGYYYMSGMVSDRHTQGIFTNLRQVEAELSQTWKFDRVPDIRNVTYGGKQYEIKIEYVKTPPGGILYINSKFMGSVFPSITRNAIDQYIKDYNRIKKQR